MSDVNVSVTFRHTQSTESLKQYVDQKVHKVGKYFNSRLEAPVVLAVDPVMDKIERQLLKHKENNKLRRRKTKN